MKKIIITGATGMVGGHALGYCLDSAQIGEVISLVRRPSGKTHPKLKEIILDDFLDYSNSTIDFKNVDAALFCIGVYTGAVDREKFRAITIDMPLAFAKALHDASPNATYCLLSGAGADRTEKSRTMFAKDKGIIENRLTDIGFGAFHAFRPGYIYPVIPRDEPNWMYSISRKLYPLIRLFGKNASIKSTELAKGMFLAAVRGYDHEILENRDILALVARER